MSSAANTPGHLSIVVVLIFGLFSTTATSQSNESNESDGWHFTNGPASGNVVAVLELDNGMVLAGTEKKGLFIRAKADEHWRQVPFSVFEDQVRALAAHDGALLAGTGNNGIYRSNDDGLTWEPLNDGLRSQFIYDFLVSRQNELFVATKKGVHRLSDSMLWVDFGGSELLDVRAIVEADDGSMLIGTFNLGKLRTSDGGNSWTQVDAAAPVRSLAVGPQGEIIAGLWGPPTVQRSDDHGKTWKTAATGIPIARVWSVAIDSSGVMYAGSAGDGIWHSADEGQSWSTNSPPEATVTSLSAAPDGGIWGGTSVGCFKSHDHGASWTVEGIPLGRVRALFSNGTRVVAGNDNGGIYFSDDLGVTWVRTNAETDAVYEIDRKIDGSLYAATRGRIYRSDDEGKTWTPLWDTHRWIFSVAVDSDGTVFAGTESGVFIQGPDSIWTRVSPPGKVFSLVVDTDDFVYAGVEHQAMFRSNNGGAIWVQVADQFLVPNECLCSIVVLPDGRLMAAALLARGVWLSADRGESWDPMDGIENEIVTDVSASSGGILVASGSTGRVFMLDSDTGRWTLLAPMAPEPVRSVALLGTDPDTVLFVGTENTGVYARIIPRSTSTEEQPGRIASLPLSVYPNPASTYATVELEVDLPGQVVLQLIDPLGRLLRSQLLLISGSGVEKIRFDTSKIPSGVYQVRAISQSGASTARPVSVVH
jgi:ligand-binding sensor domain-containing protein